MKTLKIAMALSALTFTAAAQNTGQTTYGHNSVPSYLSSGSYAITDPGFIMAGYRPTLPGASNNLFIDKVDVDGLYNASPGEFANAYKIFTGGTNCAAAQPQESNCYGISIIETFQGTTQYATASSYDSGCLIMFLDNTGALTASAFYTFPNGATSPTKPVITESIANAGDYYVCGSYVTAGGLRLMYAVKVNATGGNIWSRTYAVGVSINPRGIVESSYSGTELAVAGNMRVAGVREDAFLLTLGGGTGNVSFFGTYGTTAIDGFSSIALANSNGGYIVGGVTNVSNAGRAWMMRLNANGTSNWTDRIMPNTVNNAGDVVGVLERLSPTYGNYEYYGLTISTAGMMVLKLNDNGTAFSNGTNTNSEFVYNDGNGTIALSASMSYWDGTAADPNNGIHVFGSTDDSTPSDFFMTQACNNGAAANCTNPNNQIITTINTIFTGPGSTSAPSINASNGLNQCTSYGVSVGFGSFTPVQPCYLTGALPSTPYGGNNSRNAAPTAIGEINADAAGGVSVYPNPVSNTAQITYNAGNGGEVKIDLYNALGQHVKTLDKGYKNGGVNSVTIDLAGMSLQNGVYFVNVTVNGATSRQKLVFSGN